MSSLSQKIYRLLTDATEEEVLHPDGKVEREAPANFVKLLIARMASKLGDRLASPKTTLAWILQSLGAPPIFGGLIVPIRESGSLLPQAILSRYLKRFRIRKWGWTLGSFVQGLAIAGCGLVAINLRGIHAGIAILLLISIFSLARGLSSISAKDILGKTIPKTKRGQLSGWAGSGSGLITIGAAFFLFQKHTDSSLLLYAIYLFVSGLLWWIAALLNLSIVEEPGEREDEKSLLVGFKDQFALIKKDAAFRDFLLVRTLAIGSGLSTPYLIALAHEKLSGAAIWLGGFIIAEGLAATLSAPIWGKFADKSSRLVLRLAMTLVGMLLGLVIFYETVQGIPSHDAKIIFPIAFFLLGMAHAGVRVGRKTYIVNMAKGNDRTNYVAVANTSIGILLLIAGALTGITSLLSVPLTLGIFAVASLIGALYSLRLS